MAGPVLDNLASTLLPDEIKTKTDKPKVKTGSVCGEHTNYTSLRNALKSKKHGPSCEK